MLFIVMIFGMGAVTLHCVFVWFLAWEFDGWKPMYRSKHGQPFEIQLTRLRLVVLPLIVCMCTVYIDTQILLNIYMCNIIMMNCLHYNTYTYVYYIIHIHIHIQLYIQLYGLYIYMCVLLVDALREENRPLQPR